MIKIVGPQLTQWDTGRQVIADILVDSEIIAPNVAHIHFANQGDARAVIMDIENGQAKIPDYLLQTGKALCVYLVLDGVTQESKTFHVTKRERPENYVYEEDQRNFIYELITDAQAATEAANQVAQDLREAKEQGEFNGPKGDPFLIVNDASGYMIAIDDAANSAFAGMRIFGKTTQDGTPTPDAPVNLVSDGDSGSITVNVSGKSESKSMTIATPNGLPGIQVKSGGNYTDANGQQWICDERDLARGVYVQRVATIEPKAIGAMSFAGTHGAMITVLQTDAIKVEHNKVIATVLCSHLVSVGAEPQYISETNSIAIDTAGQLKICVDGVTTKDELTQWLSANSLKIVYPLATYIEMPLSEEELAAYAALHTYRGHTTISNDASAHMEIEYVMDAKKYIDSLVISGGGSILPATVE